MGVSCIVMWDQPEGCNPTQALELLQKKVELLGGASLGSWSIECETLHSTQTLSAGGPQKLIHMLHGSEYPRTTFAVLDSMNCIVADNSLDAIFANLKQFYAPSAKKGLKIEVKGYHYEVQKFVVKFGSIVIGASHRGVVVETEANGCEIVSKCWDKLTEFVKGLLDHSNVIAPPQFSLNNPSRPYTPSDAMIHYAYIFTQLRRPGMATTTPTK